MATLNINARQAMARFSDEVRKLKTRNRSGLAAAGAFIKLESQKRTPVDHGNLKGSHYVEHGGSRDEPEVQIYLTADYAVYVHEDLNARHTVGEAKFLENAVLENRDDILEIIKEYMTV